MLLQNEQNASNVKCITEHNQCTLSNCLCPINNHFNNDILYVRNKDVRYLIESRVILLNTKFCILKKFK